MFFVVLFLFVAVCSLIVTIIGQPNGTIGYRTPDSIKNRVTWRIANGSTSIISLGFATIAYLLHKDGFDFLAMSGFTFIFFMLLIVIVEGILYIYSYHTKKKEVDEQSHKHE